MEIKKTEIKVETETEVTPAVGVTPDPEVPVTATEKDEDQEVHETIDVVTETVVIKETDLDDVVHEQPPVLPATDGEKDIDDLMHPRI